MPGEILIGGLGALAVLVFVFASLLAVVPLLVAAVSVTGAFLAILGLTYLTPINFITQYLVGLIGLGVAIDYSLLVITRWREETARGADNEQAIITAMDTAGRSVAFSGLTVALALLPALLAGAGRRLNWPRLRSDALSARGWTTWTRLVVRARWAAAIAALAILGALGAAALGMNVGDASALSAGGQAHEGLVTLQHAKIPPGVLAPAEVVTPPGIARATVTATAMAVPGIRAVLAPAGPG